jgi:hypothetical protein
MGESSEVSGMSLACSSQVERVKVEAVLLLYSFVSTYLIISTGIYVWIRVAR